MWVGAKHNIDKKRLLTLFLDTRKSGKFHFGVKNEAIVDALWICISFTTDSIESQVLYIHIYA